MVEERLRVVFDTNIYISAAISPGGPLRAWLDDLNQSARPFDLFVSASILAEVHEKLAAKFALDPDIVDQYLADIRLVAKVVEPSRHVTVVQSDPDDNMVIDCALAAKAQLIVSADPHLFKIKNYEGIAIVHPKQLKYIFRSDKAA